MKKFLQKILNKFGLSIQKHTPKSGFTYQISTVLKKSKIDVVFDIGANSGQFAFEIRQKGYNEKIISFEPLKSARKKLIKNSSNDPKWKIHKRAAIGNEKKMVEINISKNSVSSSILPMLNSHFYADRESIYIDTEKTPVITLDSVADDYLKKNSNCFIKIDAQGYESQVLDGAKKTLQKSKGILCEMSLVPLYEGQQLWTDIISRLEKNGFILWGIKNGFTDLNQGRTLQLDGIFFKKMINFIGFNYFKTFFSIILNVKK